MATKKAPSRKRVRHLTALLIKSEFKSPKDCIKDPASVTQMEVKRGLGFTGEFYVQSKRARSAAWMGFVAQMLEGRLPEPKNDNICAVLFVRVQKRWLVFTQGHGRNLLKVDCFERDFGIKVVLNSVDPKQLRSVDVRSVESLTTQTRKQLSRNSPMTAFALNLHQDIPRVIAGKPIDEEFAKLIAGSDSLSLSAKLEVEDLGAKCEALLTAYQSIAYREHFPWFDQLRAVRDPSVIASLSTTLLETIRSKNYDDLHLAPPDIIDWHESWGFSFSTEAEPAPRHELQMEEYLRTVDEDELSFEKLKRDVVRLHDTRSEVPLSKWSVFDTLVFETELEGKVYVLSGGDWFQVDKKFADGVKAKLGRIPASKLVLPSAGSEQHEDDYNSQVAKTSKNYALMDRRNVFVDGSKTRIEVCDLFTKDCQFVHVKRKTRSATLSHLFAQGVVSADSFWMDPEYRSHTRNQIVKGRPALGALIPDTRPDPSKYEVVFAIITKRKSNWPHSLPFFSQLNLTYAHDRLMRMGYRVSLLRVDER
ncbi:TIGR04141 family sporadically distributed protein [Myxococcus sp. K38C18041901]|uniref:DUF6119 family protein n=1 Tax=Myxococcus guangdongensis TaxID=2906760 RepID=UPI0020A7D1FF|nr:DUF6119 family protein [Myxococcus guangdongensis]MCP3064882.1 TIGR04141 family sporadically distributed protein [Myxococcus guangdongensis]